MKHLISRLFFTIVILAACHGTGWATQSNTIFPTNFPVTIPTNYPVIFPPSNYPYTQTDLQPLDVIESKNGVLEATVNMFSAGLTADPIRYGTEYVYSGTGTSNNGNAGMYAFAYQWKDDRTGKSYRKGFPGTVLHLQPGDTLKVHEYNWLAGKNDPNDPSFVSNFHYHGSHAPDLSQGDNIYVQHEVGQRNDIEIKIEQYENSVGLNWYHPHVHEESKKQVQGGLAGFITVGDPLAPWPQYKGKFKEVYMAFTEVNIQTNSGGKRQFFEMALGTNSGSNYTQGWQKLINGQMNPIITMAPGETQIWLWGNVGARGGIMPVIADANRSNAWSNCTILARDGNSAFVHPYTGALSFSPVRMQDISSLSLLSTGNRTTWAITAPTNPGTYYLMDGWEGEETPNAVSTTSGPNSNSFGINNFLYVLATIKVTGTPSTTPKPVFGTQPEDPLWSAIPNNYRTFELEENPFTYQDPNESPSNTDSFYINKKKFGYGPMDQLEIGTVEEWTIKNPGPLNHPFHIHQGNFLVTKAWGMEVNPNSPPLPDFNAVNYVSPLDVIMVPAFSSVTVRFRVQNFPGKYVWHCHILEHEDEGMMSPVYQFCNRNGIRLGLGGSSPAPLVIDGSGNVVSTIAPFKGYKEGEKVSKEEEETIGPVVVASGVGTDESGLQLPVPLPTNAAQANAAYASLTVKQTMAVGCSSGSSAVRVYSNGTNIPTVTFQAFPKNTGVSLAVGGISANGAVRIAVGSRANGPANVRIFDASGKLLNEYKGFMPGNFPNGVNVAIGDVNHDNFDDLIVSAGAGREAIITALNGKDIAANSKNPEKLFSVVNGDPGDNDGVKIAVGFVAPATVPSYYPNLVTTPEVGVNSGSVQVWNTADLAGAGTMAGMSPSNKKSSSNSQSSTVMPLAEFRPFGTSPAPVNIATSYLATTQDTIAQPVIAAWQLGRQATFTTIDLNNVPHTTLRRW